MVKRSERGNSVALCRCVRRSRTKEAVQLRSLMTGNDFVLNPNEVRLIPTGFAMYIADPNVTALVVPRSGLGYKHGIVLSNLVGVIDADYQGQLMVPLWNHSTKPFTVRVGDRVAQMLFIPVLHPTFEITEEFSSPSARGTEGFGSTGNR